MDKPIEIKLLMTRLIKSISIIVINCLNKLIEFDVSRVQHETDSLKTISFLYKLIWYNNVNSSLKQWKKN